MAVSSPSVVVVGVTKCFVRPITVFMTVDSGRYSLLVDCSANQSKSLVVVSCSTSSIVVDNFDHFLFFAFCDHGLRRLIFVVVSGIFCIGGVYRGFVDLYRLYRPPCIGCIGVVSFVSGCIVCIGICIVCIGCCLEQLYRLYRVVSTLAKCADSFFFLSMYSNSQKYQYR